MRRRGRERLEHPVLAEVDELGRETAALLACFELAEHGVALGRAQTTLDETHEKLEVGRR